MLSMQWFKGGREKKAWNTCMEFQMSDEFGYNNELKMNNEY